MSTPAFLPCGRASTTGPVIGLVLAVLLAGCQALVQTPWRAPERAQAPDRVLGARLAESLRVMVAPASDERQRAQAQADYRALVAGNLKRLLRDAARARPGPAAASAASGVTGALAPARFAALTPVARAGPGEPGLYRAGLGLPLVGRIFPGGDDAPAAGFQVPLTLLALPRGPALDCCDAALVDPRRTGSVRTDDGELPVAMDLEAPIDASRATGPRYRDGLMNLLRPERLGGESRFAFLEPYDPDKTPVVLVHGLMSTPRMWAPVVKGLLADPRIRDHYQFWFFYYPTSKPIPISALRLRETLDAVAARYPDHKPMLLIGHSMGGILARTQVSGIGPEVAARISPEIVALPQSNPVRRALVFEPRRDVSRVVFMFTPHRGSRLAVNRLGAWGMRLARLPGNLIAELGNYAHLVPDAIDGRLPTSIHGLSPQSQFLKLLDQTRPVVPAHSIIGVRRGTPPAGSDGVVSYRSAHLDTAASEAVVQAGHSGVAHPDSIAELRRILLQSLRESEPPLAMRRAWADRSSSTIISK